METAPTLPDFALALKPDEYQLPQVDSSWRTEHVKGAQSGATNHLNGWQNENGLKYITLQISDVILYQEKGCEWTSSSEGWFSNACQ